MNHTPTPWTVSDMSLNPNNGTEWRDILAKSDYNGADMYVGEAMKDDAQFIATACNAYEELVSLLDDAVSGRYAISPDWYTRAQSLLQSLKKGA